MKIVILIPTYNERENIQRLIPQIFFVCPNVYVTVIDDNSPDGTAAEVLNLQLTYPQLSLYKREKKEGLGRAYLDAFRAVLGNDHNMDLICTMDADLSHDPAHLPALLAESADHDYVIGSRYVPGGSISGWEPWRKLLSHWGNRYCRLVTRLPIRDCTSGFACIRATLLRQIDFSDFDTSGYAFLMYLKYKAWQQGAKMSEVPICFKNRITGESKISVNIIREGLLLPWKLIRKPKRVATISPVCPLCQSQQTHFWLRKNNTDVYRCRACRLIFVSPLPENIDRLYSKDYFCGAHNGFGYINYDEDKEVDTQSFNRYLVEIESARGEKKGRLLDVGAATGAFLSIAANAGWQVEGVEISNYAASAARQKGLNVHAGELENAPLAVSSFDAITMWDVFEHVRSPRATLNKVCHLLKPNGLLVINTPDAGSLHAHLRGNKWPLIIPPEHTYLFNRNNIARLLAEQGFAVVKFTTIGKRFTPAYIFQILYTNRHFKLWRVLSNFIKKTPLNNLAIPINLRDNMFVLARKR